MILRVLVLVLLAGLCSVTSARAGSDAQLPGDWQSWPIHHSGQILANKTAIPETLPPIVRETMKAYNWINDGKGSAYNVRINPAKLPSVKDGKGKFADGPTSVLELTDIKAVFVTEHLLGDPQYGAWSFDGKDLSAAHPSLAPKFCATCHSGYGEACVAGSCTK